MVYFVRKLLLATYALVKDFLPFRLLEKYKFLSLVTKAITIVLTIIVLAALFLLLMPFVLFRTVLNAILKLIYRDDYGGLLSGMDTLYEINQNKTVFNIIIIISKAKEKSDLIENLKKVIRNAHETAFRFTCCIKRICGYSYFLKNRVKPEDILEIISGDTNQCMTKDMLYDYLEENCLTIKENQMWKMIVFTQPIRWSEDVPTRKEQYAVIMKIRHSLGDGPSIVAVLKRSLRETSDIKEAKFNPPKHRDEMNLDNVYVYRNPILSRKDGAALKIPHNSNCHLATFIEPEREYISVIKKIKQKLNVSFTDVISAAICSSINDYIEKRKVKMNNVTLSSVVRVRDQDLLQIVNGTYDFNNVFNKASVVAFKLPFGPSTRNMRDKILAVHRASDSLKGSVDFFLAHGFLRSVCALLPNHIRKILILWFMTRITICISNLIGFRKSSLYDFNLDDTFFFVPKFVHIGFMFCIFSYDGRLGMAVTSEKGYVYDREELQAILDNVFKYIDEAEREIMYIENRDAVLCIDEYVGTYL